MIGEDETTRGLEVTVKENEEITIGRFSFPSLNNVKSLSRAHLSVMCLLEGTLSLIFPSYI